MQRITGKARPLLVLGLVFCLCVFVYAIAFPTSVFELEGNVADAGGNSLDDWATLNGNGLGNPAGSAGGSQARTFVNDPENTTIFTTGGSKDNADISSWRHTNGSVPDKDEITNGYAAAYNVGGDLVLTFGADRKAQNGDANIGIWFFQTSVGPDPDNAGRFTGTHMNGDVFIVSAFSGGGGISTITAYEWDNACTGAVQNATVGQCADANLRVLFKSTDVCGATSLACGITNAVGIPVAWAYTPKSGTAGTIPKGGFFEGGLNLTQVFLNAGVTALPCFSSFLVETRSSTSIDAVLKDFVADEFPLCGITQTKACDGDGVLNAAGDKLIYSFKGTVSNVGVGTLYDVEILDTLPGGATQTIQVASSLAGNASANWTFPNALETTSTSVTNTALAKAALTPGGPKSIVSGTASQVTCTATVNSAIKIDKDCTTSLVDQSGLVAVRVAFSGNVCNDSSVKLTGVTLADDPSATFTTSSSGITLNPKGTTGDCFEYAGNYLPSTRGTQDGTIPGRYFFEDTIKVTAATPSLGGALPDAPTCGTGVKACATASCPICPANACPAE